MKKVHIISGGTVAHIATHLALSAPAYGKVGEELYSLCRELMPELETVLHLTKMAGGTTEIHEKYGPKITSNSLETNNDVLELVNQLIADPDTKIIFMPVALCDFVATDINVSTQRRPEYWDWEYLQNAEDRGQRLSSKHEHQVNLYPAPKIIPLIRAKRKDIFLVGFKTTDGVSEDEQYLAGLALCKGSSCNLVLANDVKTRVNMIITPEEARYHVTKDRSEVLRELVEMTKMRSHLTFTRSTVVAGEPVPWADARVPATLRSVVDHLIAQGAYKPFHGATVGHFACKLPKQECEVCKGWGKRFFGSSYLNCPDCDNTGQQKGDTFLTSQRKTNFNDLAKLGLVMVRTDGPDSVLAYGAKPSVGGQSQRILFGDHPEYDCVVHAHVPMKRRCVCEHVVEDHDSQSETCTKCDCREWVWQWPAIPVVSQREFECGSHQCGKNTSDGMREFTLPSGHKIMVVFLAEHGPNILFHHSAPAQEICDFIDANFDLSKKTGGYVS